MYKDGAIDIKKLSKVQRKHSKYLILIDQVPY
jgi:hypothetical protein